MDHVQNYLLNHDNRLLFEVRSHEKGKYIVSVINGMYKLWKHAIEESIYKKNAIEVHIDSLTKGGYLCHTSISTLKELTGKDYTHSVFIPGSAIVLNIENDFERWIDEDVLIIPQKFVEFRTNYREGVVENSLVGSRKLLLQMKGNIHLFEIYNRYLLTKSENFKAEPESLQGHVTGIINSGKKTGVFVELD
jgi:ribosomal protein S1